MAKTFIETGYKNGRLEEISVLIVIGSNNSQNNYGKSKNDVINYILYSIS